MPSQTYTTAARVTKRMSADGVLLRQDDDEAALTQFIGDASDELEFYLTVRYAPADLATNGWVLKIATDITVALYCARRLNTVPEHIAAEADFAFERMEKIQAGALKIPGLATKKDMAPALSNFRPRLRPFNRPVVVPGTSTGTAENYVRHEDRYDWPDYTI